MAQFHLINNTATVIYSYIIDPNRPPITKQLEDSTYNYFIPTPDANYDNGLGQCMNNGCWNYPQNDTQYTVEEDPEKTTGTQDAENSIETEIPQYKDVYTIPDSLYFSTHRGKVRSIQDVTGWLNTIESIQPANLMEGDTPHGLLVRGNYIVRVRYLNRKYRTREYYYRRQFQKVISLEEPQSGITRVSQADLSIDTIFWEDNRLYIDTQMDISLER